MAGAGLPHPRPHRHPLRRVARDPAPTSSSGRRPPRPTGPTPPATSTPSRPPTCGGWASCRPSTPAPCWRTSPRSATSVAPRASPTRVPTWAAWCRSPTWWPTSTSAWPGRTAPSTWSWSAGASRRCTPDLVEILDRILERDVTRILVNTNGMRLAHDDALLAALAAAPRPGRGLPPVRRLPLRHPPPSPGGRRGRGQAQGGRASDRGRDLHHPHHDRRPGRQRRRDRRRGQPRPRHPLRGRGEHPAPVRVGPVGRHRPPRPPHPHRRAGPPRAPDGRPLRLAGHDRPALLPPPLLQHRLRHAHRRRRVEVAGGHDRPRGAEGQPRPGQQPHRRPGAARPPAPAAARTRCWDC